MKDGDGLNDVLGYARPVEGNQHSEHLSKLYLEIVKSTKTVEVVDKKNGKNKKFGVSKSRQNSKYGSQSRDKKGCCHNCGSKHPPKQCPPYGKECYHCRKKNHFSNMCQSHQCSRSSGGHRSQAQCKRFSHKDQHEMEVHDPCDDSKWYTYEQESTHIQFTTKNLYN